MIRTLFYDLLTFPLNLTRPRFLEKWLHTWSGKRPSLALLYKFYRDSNLAYDKDNTLHLLDYPTLKVLGESTPYFRDQIIKENNHQDEVLLSKSSLKLYPHEVTQVRIINAQNEDFSSQVFHGGPYKGLDAITLKKVIRRLCFAARKKGLIIEEVEVAHTHPALEVIVEKKKESTFFFNGLSTADKNLGRNIAPFVDYPLRIKAVSPIANYSCLY